MILIINICKENLHYYEFVKPVEDILEKNEFDFFTKNYMEVDDSDIEKADKVIICGTSLKDNGFFENIKEFDWLKNFKKPVLGICAGAHIIGLILGKELEKEKEIGLKKITIEKSFLGASGDLKVYHLHQFKVLPEVFNKDNFYATLFHPEVRNEGMITSFLRQ